MIRMEEKQPAGVHRFSLENRRKAVITGVQDIHSFNENEVLLLSEAGKILLKGEQLHVRNLNLEKGRGGRPRGQSFVPYKKYTQKR